MPTGAERNGLLDAQTLKRSFPNLQSPQNRTGHEPLSEVIARFRGHDGTIPADSPSVRLIILFSARPCYPPYVSQVNPVCADFEATGVPGGHRS